MSDFAADMAASLALSSTPDLSLHSSASHANMPYHRHSKLLKPGDGSENKETPATSSWSYPKRILKSLSPKKPLPPAPEPPTELPASVPCITLDPLRSAVEVSNYPPNLTKMDIRGVFSDFHIADFDLRSARSFSTPLRVRIEVAGKGEAERAVRVLDGRVIEGKKLAVRAVEAEPYENKEAVMDEIADELKVQIISMSALSITAPEHLADRIRHCTNVQRRLLVDAPVRT